jgi:alpha 1,3-glucosidase
VLNENAQEFWGQRFSYENFPGSNYMYSIWNDMNEPSVFNTPSKTIPLDALHFKKDGRSFEHRDLHNAYGALHHRSTWRGLLARDNNTQRPFVLTRSFFMGS